MNLRTATLLARLVSAAVLAGAANLLPATVAAAAPVAAAATVRSITVDPSAGPPLTNAKITGSGFCPAPCGPVSISVGSLYIASGIPVATNGTFSTLVRIPGTVRPGPVEVVAAQTVKNGTTEQARDTFTVTINQPAPTKYPAPSTIAPPGGLPPPTGRTAGGGTPATSAAAAASVGGPPARADNGTPVATRPTSGTHGTTVWPWIVLAVLVAVGLAAGAWWGLRRRRAVSR